MWTRSAVIFAALIGGVGLGAGCSKSIGDACVLSTDCDQDGTRECDISAHDGYCTIEGCDYDTCPGNSECVSFYTGQFSNEPCNYLTEDIVGGTNDCTPDEVCDLTSHCAARSSEVRYCMAKCSSNGDCRDEYECRDFALMIAHGGEPVLAPGTQIGSDAPGFCASSQSTD